MGVVGGWDDKMRAVIIEWVMWRGWNYKMRKPVAYGLGAECWDWLGLGK